MKYMDHKLFKGELIYLDAFDPEKDAEVEARWTNDPGFVWPLEGQPAKPLSAGQVKKQHEKDKEAGFVLEGRVREELNRNGRRWDGLYMGILREEWAAIQKSHLAAIG